MEASGATRDVNGWQPSPLPVRLKGSPGGPLPVFVEDLEAGEGLLEDARHNQAVVRGHHGLRIVPPEYNCGIAGALTHAL